MAKRSVPLRPHVPDALSVWGQLIRRGRINLSWTAKDLATRANVSEQTVLAPEGGSRGTAAGTMTELSDLVGVPLVGIEDRAELAIRRQRGQELLALLPSRVGRPVPDVPDDNFSRTLRVDVACWPDRTGPGRQTGMVVLKTNQCPVISGGSRAENSEIHAFSRP
jgi:transcriptional regulator with XRE-family HTH domain